MEKPVPPRTLVVDDEPLIRWAVARALRGRGSDTFEAANANAAIDAVASAPAPFDVIILDLRLPDSDDLKLLATVRRIAPSSQIVLMTAFGTEDVVKSALDMGAFRVVRKPFEVKAMVGVILDAYEARKTL